MTPDYQEKIIEEFSNITGCCGGDYCGQGQARDYDHDKALSDFLRTALQQAHSEGARESDLGELQNLARQTATWFDIHYSEVENNWTGKILSCAQSEEAYFKKRGDLTGLLQEMKGHLRSLLQSSSEGSHTPKSEECCLRCYGTGIDHANESMAGWCVNADCPCHQPQ